MEMHGIMDRMSKSAPHARLQSDPMKNTKGGSAIINITEKEQYQQCSGPYHSFRGNVFDQLTHLWITR